MAGLLVISFFLVLVVVGLFGSRVELVEDVFPVDHVFEFSALFLVSHLEFVLEVSEYLLCKTIKNGRK